MEFIMPLLYFLLANATLVYFSKKTFGKCLPVAMMLSAFILLFSQIIFKTFQIGFYLNILLALAIIPILFKNRKDLSKFKENYFTNSFIAFITIYTIIYIFDFNRIFTGWDEKSHWGVMIKEMLRIDRLYSTADSTLMVHKDYPPILQIFELFWLKLCNHYSEATLVKALHTLEISLFIPFISEKKREIKKTIINSFILVFVVLLTLLFFDRENILNSIYNDYFMAILVAFIIGFIINNKNLLDNFNIFTISLSSCFLLLTKQMGLPLYLMILFIFFLTILINKKEKVRNLKKMIVLIVAVVIIPLCFWKGWNMYVDTLDVRKQFVLSDIYVENLYSIVKGKSGEAYQTTSARNYISAIKDKNLTTSRIQLSYIQAILLGLLLTCLVCYKSKLNKKQSLIVLLTLTLGAIGYAFVMLNMYVFSFGSYEGPILASFDRYMTTYVILLLFVDLMVYLKYEKNRIILLFIVLLLIQSPTQIIRLKPSLRTPSKNIFELKSEKIIANTDEDSKIYVIAQNSTGEYQFYIKYYINPRTTNLDNFNLPLDNTKDYFYKNVNDYMLEFDYLYLAVIDDAFIDSYSFLFDNTIKEGQLYKIIDEEGNVKLQLIG